MRDTKAVIRSFLRSDFLMGGEIEIADDTSFMDNHVLDSTGFIELITFVEETFGVTVDDEEMVPENFDSLLAIEAYLARKGAA